MSSCVISKFISTFSKAASFLFCPDASCIFLRTHLLNRSGFPPRVSSTGVLRHIKEQLERLLNCLPSSGRPKADMLLRGKECGGIREAIEGSEGTNMLRVAGSVFSMMKGKKKANPTPLPFRNLQEFRNGGAEIGPDVLACPDPALLTSLRQRIIGIPQQ
mmetsp:Transcript_40821/g.128592  ORF Transcript_40821/g.128592 Transcript_40821/m.128592 type:complete len:160 (-) Transcript_40821:85-564(-)